MPMSKLSPISCEEFYFKRIAATAAGPADYREFFELLWQSHGEFAFKMAFSWLNNLEDARDVCQDAFLRAMEFLQKNPGRIPLKVNFRAWLRAIIRHLVYDRFRRVLTQGRPQGDEALEVVPVELSPEDRLATTEELIALTRCISRLGDDARTLIQLRDLEGLSEREVAARLNITTNNVGVALHRARKSLRECVGPQVR